MPAPLPMAALLLPTLLALALALRLHQLGLAPLWMDEIATAFFIALPWRDLFGPIAALEPNPPGWYLLGKAFVPVLGDGARGLRLPAALAGAAAAIPVFLYARAAFGLGAAAAAGLLLALAPVHLIQSQEARNYALLFLLAACTLLHLDHALAAPRPRLGRLALVQGLLWAGMLWMHATAAFFLAGLGAYALVLLAPRGRGAGPVIGALAAAAALAILLAGWWFALVLGLVRQPTAALSWIPPLTPDWAWRTLAIPLAGRFLAPDWRHAALPPFLLSLLAAALLARRRRDRRAAALLAALAAGLGTMLLASLWRNVVLERTALAFLVFLLPLQGFAVAALRPRALGLGLLGALLAISALGVRHHYAEDRACGRRCQPFAHAIQSVEARIAPDERMVVAGTFELLEVARSAGPRLARLVLARLPHAAELDPQACPPAGLPGLWGLGVGPPGTPDPDGVLRPCGSAPVLEERHGQLPLRRFRAPD